MTDKTILVVGTYDTKNDELTFLANVIKGQGGKVVTMDVSVLGNPSKPADYSKNDVAQEGGSSIQAAIDSGDENQAMQIMAKGASQLSGCDIGAAFGGAKIHCVDGVFFTTYSCGAVGCGHADDPLGWWALRFEFGLQSVVVASGRGRVGGRARRATARPGQAFDWDDVAWHIGFEIRDPAETSIGRARV